MIPSPTDLLPELPGFLKYGLIGLAALLFFLAFYLIINEQKKSSSKHLKPTSVSTFLILGGAIIGLIGILSPSASSKQEINTKLEGSNHNSIITSQDKDDSTDEQVINTELIQADSNRVETKQVGKESIRKVK